MKIVSTKPPGKALYSHLQIIADTRHCELAGYSFEQKFHVSVDVTEPSMAISKFDFEVDIGMQLDVGDILQR